MGSKNREVGDENQIIREVGELMPCVMCAYCHPVATADKYATPLARIIGFLIIRVVRFVRG